MATERLIRHLERHGIGDVRPFGAAPTVEAEVSVAQLRELARSDQVGCGVPSGRRSRPRSWW
jgi:hypothetical protein